MKYQLIGHVSEGEDTLVHIIGYKLSMDNSVFNVSPGEFKGFSVGGEGAARTTTRINFSNVDTEKYSYTNCIISSVGFGGVEVELSQFIK